MEQAVSGNGVMLVTTNGPGQLYGLLLDLSSNSKVSLYKENFIKELAHCLNICSTVNSLMQNRQQGSGRAHKHTIMSPL